MTIISIYPGIRVLPSGKVINIAGVASYVSVAKEHNQIYQAYEDDTTLLSYHADGTYSIISHFADEFGDRVFYLDAGRREAMLLPDFLEMLGQLPPHDSEVGVSRRIFDENQ
ncbi:MAG: hypothetical protein ACRCYP_05205 [Alphaproteobacteria bacterium]